MEKMTLLSFFNQNPIQTGFYESLFIDGWKCVNYKNSKYPWPREENVWKQEEQWKKNQKSEYFSINKGGKEITAKLILKIACGEK